MVGHMKDESDKFNVLSPFISSEVQVIDYHVISIGLEIMKISTTTEHMAGQISESPISDERLRIVLEYLKCNRNAKLFHVEHR